MVTSKLCTFSDFQQTWFRDALVDLDEGFVLHRKQWEFAIIYQALKERGMLAPGRSGLGFAVGTEPLPSIFCRRGASILATDQAVTEDAKVAWGEGQLCLGIDRLNERGLCTPEEFSSLCRFRVADMRTMPDDLGKYDFVWSSCAFEHLGSLEAGMDFVVNSSRFLLPGGVAVHTTEFNLSSDRDTISEGGSVYYRRRDIEEIGTRLRGVGCRLEPVDWDRGDHPVDNLVDEARLNHGPVCHLKLKIDQYTLTSILVVARKDE